MNSKFHLEKGSLALEQVLFISAVVILSSGIYAFYTELAGYFENFSIATPPTSFGAPNAG